MPMIQFPQRYVQQNPKFWPYFKDALGAIDGSHINFAPPASLHDVYQNCKASSPKTAFLHAYFLFNFAMPSLDEKALPLMLEYGMMPIIMILWCQKVNIILQMQVILLSISCWFHIKVCATILQSGVGPMCSMWSFLIKYPPHSPANKEELFNLHHASACNVIQYIFGVFKHRF